MPRTRNQRTCEFTQRTGYEQPGTVRDAGLLRSIAPDPPVHRHVDRHAVDIDSEALKLRTYAQARLGLLIAQVQQLQDTAGLVVALGGGWWKDQRLSSAQ